MLAVTAAILLDGSGRVLVAQRPATGNSPLKWEFPGGKLKEGESPEAALRRELHEELGIDVEVGEVFHVVSHSYPDRVVLLMAYRCHWHAGEIRLQEHAACRWMEVDRLMELDLAEADRPIARRLLDRCRRSDGGGRKGKVHCAENRKQR